MTLGVGEVEDETEIEGDADPEGVVLWEGVEDCEAESMCTCDTEGVGDVDIVADEDKVVCGVEDADADRDALEEGDISVAEADGVGDVDTDADRVRRSVGDAETDREALNEGDVDTVVDEDKVVCGVGDADADREALEEGDISVAEADGVGDVDIVADEDKMVCGVGDADADKDALEEGDISAIEADGVGDVDTDADRVGGSVGDAEVDISIAEADGVGDVDTDADRVGRSVGDPETDRKAVEEGDIDPEEDKVLDNIGEIDADEKSDDEGLEVGDISVTEADGVAECEIDSEDDTVGTNEAVAVDVPDKVTDGETLRDWEGDGELETGNGVTVGELDSEIKSRVVVGDNDPVGDTDGVELGEDVEDIDPEKTGVVEKEMVSEGDSVGVMVFDGVSDVVTEGEGPTVGDSLGDSVGAMLWETVKECGDEETENVTCGDGVMDGNKLSDMDPDGDADGVTEWDIDCEPETVCITGDAVLAGGGETDEEWDIVSDSEGDMVSEGEGEIDVGVTLCKGVEDCELVGDEETTVVGELEIEITIEPEVVGEVLGELEKVGKRDGDVVDDKDGEANRREDEGV